MTHKPTQPAPGARHLREARRMYRRWCKTLTVYLDALEADSPGELAAASKHQAALASHYKTLEKLSELERDLDGRLEQSNSAILDLGAARAEILGRLAKRDDAGCADQVS